MVQNCSDTLPKCSVCFAGVETSVTVQLSNRIHPVDDISLTYPFGMEIQMTTGYENGTFDARWENDQISFQRGMYFFP